MCLPTFLCLSSQAAAWMLPENLECLNVFALLVIPILQQHHQNLISACYYLSVPMLPLFYIFRCCIALFQYRNTDFPYRSLSNDYGSLMIQWLTLHQGGPPLRWWTEGHSSIHCKIQRIIKYWLKIKHLPFTWKYLLTFKWKAAEASCRIKTFFAQTLPASKRCY